MSKITITTAGLQDVKQKLLQLGMSMEEAVSNGLFVTAQDIRTDAIKSIQQVSPGRTVMRSRQGGGTYPHTASNEGYAPNTDTGALVNSIHVYKNNDLDYDIEAGINYASCLEFGTKKMEERPFLHPALDKNKNNLVNNVKKVLTAKIKALSK